ncbi:hypothetical protein COT72_01095 [archaeon CG10_big_fil_rev_8_21_14_0_10_43_11]|nr:MAG: hypothetical protein COT72_01095 [archaeon CG10_big_fil_rev_8_21_14_0_10_43_11]
MKIGIVGKPSAGKSTLFKAATMVDVDIANYPFTTIKPNHAVGYVRVKCVESFFNVTCNPREGFCIDGERFVPVELVDVAGLVPGAHEGKGMGNQFLDDLRQGDALIHVVDASGSTNEKGESVQPGTHDPVRDVTFLEEELDMWFFGILKKGWLTFAKSAGAKEVHKAVAKQMSGLGVSEDLAKDVLLRHPLSERVRDWTDADLKGLARVLRKKTKPIIIAANKMDVVSGKDGFERLKTAFPQYTIIACSGMAEVALKELDRAEKIKYIPGDAHFEVTGALDEKQRAITTFIKEHVLNVFGTTGIQSVLNTTVFDVLNYVYVFPGSASGKLGDKHGNILPDCYLLPPGSTALDFAYHVHTDFGKKFIKAIDVRKKQTIGKEHELASGDVIEIMSGR